MSGARGSRAKGRASKATSETANHEYSLVTIVYSSKLKVKIKKLKIIIIIN